MNNINNNNNILDIVYIFMNSLANLPNRANVVRYIRAQLDWMILMHAEVNNNAVIAIVDVQDTINEHDQCQNLILSNNDFIIINNFLNHLRQLNLLELKNIRNMDW